MTRTGITDDGESREPAILDRPKSVREEDAFDVGAMHAWLSTQVSGLTAPPTVAQFPGGASNLTYLLRYPDRDLILRRPPAGTKARSAHDMSREYTVQRHLGPVFGKVPDMIAVCTDESVLGSDFYVMSRVPGVILRSDPPAGLELPPEGARHLSERAVDTLVALHGVDPGTAGLADLGRGEGYVQRQVSGWSRRFRAAWTPDVPDFEEIMGWLAAEQPGDIRTCIIHNDFRLDNLVLRPEDLDVVAVLDWEMATLGDPLMDLGGAMAYWVQADDDAGMQAARRQPTHLPGMFTREEFVDRYASRAGVDVPDWRFYEVFGLFRLAGIAQQIHYRYRHGQTTNPAFAAFGPWVSYCETRCRRIAGL